jgi:hypothetical protein
MSVSKEFKTKHYCYSHDVEKYYCNSCKHFNSILELFIINHCLTEHASKKEKKNECKYYCENCDYFSPIEILFKIHCKIHHNDCYDNHSLMKR